ncbi:integrase core domain-containing protein [Thermochromatium tepidum]|uniref:Transposase n=3 Tax=Thermochromatium tepidum TaxID=1050 RepID=A0A6I6E7E4_THETI|nr:integrase core domain-containing protein [Thermochromatium tepidum]QGU32573.1 transposase [Thermochromatium tepidum ATCC 43061]
MRVQHIGYRIRGFYRVAALGHLWDMPPKDAQRRLEILRFFDKHGLAATRDAFGVSRRTLYRWQAALKAAGGNPAALAARSCAPKKRRTPNTDPRLVSDIRRLRALYPNLGKAKLHVLLAPWCAREGIISRAPDKRRHPPCRIDRRGRVKPLRRHTKPRTPKQVRTEALEVLACDTLERIRDGMRRYLVTFIDPISHFAFARGLPSKHARHTARALQRRLSLLPHTPKTVLSDSGSEFEADFARLLDERGLQRWYTDPKTPKMNAHAERFNRTIQESFVDDHEDLLYTDLALFNRKLADWRVFYNAQRPHHALGQQAPLSFLLKNQPDCQRYWTHTKACQGRGAIIN